MTDVYSEALERLSRVPGVRGALIVETEAGVPVVAELAEGVDGSAIAALAASLFRRTTRAAHTASGSTPRMASRKIHLCVPGRTLNDTGRARANSTSGRCRNGYRISS